MAFKFVLTTAGKKELINAEHSGTARVKLSRVGFGSGTYTPTPAQSEMLHKFKDITAVGGQNVGDNIVHIQATDQSADEYTLYEVGIYTDTGTLFAIYSQDKPILVKVKECGALLAMDLAITEGDPGKIDFGSAQFSNPPATTVTAGVVKLATNQEAKLGLSSDKVITAANLGSLFANYADESGLGYLRLPGNRLLQFGKSKFDPDGQKIVFPIAFEEQLEFAAATAKDLNFAIYFWLQNAQKENATFLHNGNGAAEGYWFAVGR